MYLKRYLINRAPNGYLMQKIMVLSEANLLVEESQKFDNLARQKRTLMP